MKRKSKNNDIWRVARRALVLTTLIIFCGSALADFAKNLTEQGVAVAGYDVTSYFEDKPTPGNKAYAHKHEGANYWFSSRSSMEKFIENPEKYVPEYGGYCAYGVRVGKKFDIEPTAYRVVDNRLYVLLNLATRELWEQDREKNIEIGNQLWSKIQTIPAAELNAE